MDDVDLLPCPFCGGGETTIEGKGQIWRGMKGYSDPQYFFLNHFCARPSDDDFVVGHFTLRCRSEADAIARWNTRAALAAMGPVWRPIETVPKDGTRVDLWCKRVHCHGHEDRQRVCNASWGDMAELLTGKIYQGWRGIHNPYAELTPTHWTPLPAAPQEPEA